MESFDALELPEIKLWMKSSSSSSSSSRTGSGNNTRTKARPSACHPLTVVIIVTLTLSVQLPLLWWLRPEVTIRPEVDLKAVIRPGVNSTLIQPTKMDGKLFLLVVVFSSTRNYERRSAIRRTWASPRALAARPIPLPYGQEEHPLRPSGHGDQLGVKVVFLLGVDVEGASGENGVASESRQYNDIVQQDFVDAYDNLTIKAVMMLKWVTSWLDASNGGRSVDFLMKTDDDTFVNVPRLVETLKVLSPRPEASNDLMVGSVICHGRVVRNIYDKFYVPPSIMEETFYPSYLSGSGYVMSGSLAAKLYSAAFRTKFLFLEDVYVTGMLPDSAKITFVNHPGFSSSWRQRPLQPCVFHYAVTAHHMTAMDMERMWARMNDAELACGLDHFELSNSQRSTCGENWFFDFVNSFS